MKIRAGIKGAGDGTEYGKKLKHRYSRAPVFGLLTILLLMASFFAAGCGVEPKQKEAEDTLNIGTISMDGNFNPFFYNEAEESPVMELTSVTLLGSDLQGKPIPFGASYQVHMERDHDTDKNVTVYTFQLAEGLTFGDGIPVTPEDVIFSIEVLCDPEYDGGSKVGKLPILGIEAYRIGESDAISGVRKVDERTVSIILDKNAPMALWTLGGIVIAPRHFYLDPEVPVRENLDQIKKKRAEYPGAGPYMLKSYDGNYAKLDANQYYFKGIPSIANIRIQQISYDNLARWLKEGAIDIMKIPAESINVKAVELAKMETVMTASGEYGYIGINSKNLRDDNLRKGLMCLMNRKILRDYFSDTAILTNYPISVDSWLYPQEDSVLYAYDPETALEYFKKAGYEQNATEDGVVLEKYGIPLTVVVGAGGSGMMDYPAAEIFTQMKQDLEEMGGSLQICDYDLLDFRTGLYDGSWDIWTETRTLTVDPDFDRYGTNAEGNYYSLSNRDIDQLLADVKQKFILEERYGDYEKIISLLGESAVEMPLYQKQNLYMIDPKTVDMDSLKEMSQFRDYIDDIVTLKLVSEPEQESGDDD